MIWQDNFKAVSLVFEVDLLINYIKTRSKYKEAMSYSTKVLKMLKMSLILLELNQLMKELIQTHILV